MVQGWNISPQPFPSFILVAPLTLSLLRSLSPISSPCGQLLILRKAKYRPRWLALLCTAEYKLLASHCLTSITSCFQRIPSATALTQAVSLRLQRMPVVLMQQVSPMLIVVCLWLSRVCPLNALNCDTLLDQWYSEDMFFFAVEAFITINHCLCHWLLFMSDWFVRANSWTYVE
jgi:hypothetical protein